MVKKIITTGETTYETNVDIMSGPPLLLKINRSEDATRKRTQAKALKEFFISNTQSDR